MKTELVEPFTFKQVRDYLRRINAPVFIRECCSSKSEYSIMLRRGADYRVANLFIIDSSDDSELNKAVCKQKLYESYVGTGSFDYPFKSVAIVFKNMHGKML